MPPSGERFERGLSSGVSIAAFKRGTCHSPGFISTTSWPGNTAERMTAKTRRGRDQQDFSIGLHGDFVAIGSSQTTANLTVKFLESAIIVADHHCGVGHFGYQRFSTGRRFQLDPKPLLLGFRNIVIEDWNGDYLRGFERHELEIVSMSGQL